MSKDPVKIILTQHTETIYQRAVEDALDTVRRVVKANTPMSLEAAIICTQIDNALERLEL